MNIRETALCGLPVTNCEIIDAHVHFGYYNSCYVMDVGPEQVIAEMDRLGIDKVCVSSLGALSSRAAPANAGLAEIIDRYPDRVLGYIFANPNNPREMKAEIRKYARRKGFIGIKLHPREHGYPLTGELYNHVWEAALEHNLAVLVHTVSYEPLNPVVAYFDILPRFPELTLFIGHSGLTYEGYEQCYKLVEKYENVYMELCGSVYESDKWIEDVAAQTNPGRLIFGTDQIFLNPAVNLSRIALSQLDDDIKKDILGANIRRALERLGRL